MPGLGGTAPYPRKLGGGKTKVSISLEGLAADRGSAYDSSNPATIVYAENMAFARAIAAAWSANERLSHLWAANSMPVEILSRWEAILALPVSIYDNEGTRRRRVAEVLSRFGNASVAARATSRLTAELGDAFVALEHIDYSIANIIVPDNTYPWGVVSSEPQNAPWSSSVAHVLVRLQKPTGWTEGQFYEAAAKVHPILDPIMPAWCTYNWYRPGTSSSNVTGGPSAAGFIVGDPHNLSEQVFA